MTWPELHTCIPSELSVIPECYSHWEKAVSIAFYIGQLDTYTQYQYSGLVKKNTQLQQSS